MVKIKNPKDRAKNQTPVTVTPAKSASSLRRHVSVTAAEKTPTAEQRRRSQLRELRDQGDRMHRYKSVPPGHGNNPELIKYYLVQNFTSPASLAREAHVSRAAVSSVIHGRTRSVRIERMIADICGRTLPELFPAWYGKSK